MFKVPNDPRNPTYDNTRTIGFWQWLTSSKADRSEWRRRRDAATHTTRTARTLHAYERHAEARVQEGRQAKADLKAERQQIKADRRTAKAHKRQARQTRRMH